MSVGPERPYRCLDEFAGERMSPHGSAGFFLSGSLLTAALYASSTAFRFSCSSLLSGGRSAFMEIPGVDSWAKASAVSKMTITPAATRYRILTRAIHELCANRGKRAKGYYQKIRAYIRVLDFKDVPLIDSSAAHSLMAFVNKLKRSVRSGTAAGATDPRSCGD